MRGMEPLAGACGAQMVPQDGTPTAGVPTSELPLENRLAVALQSALTATMLMNNNIIQLDLEGPSPKLREVPHHITQTVAALCRSMEVRGALGMWLCSKTIATVCKHILRNALEIARCCARSPLCRMQQCCAPSSASVLRGFRQCWL